MSKVKELLDKLEKQQQNSYEQQLEDYNKRIEKNPRITLQTPSYQAVSLERQALEILMLISEQIEELQNSIQQGMH